MKPLGREYYKDKTGGKHKSKVGGVECSWWKDSHTPNKRLEKRSIDKEIEDGLDLYGYLLDELTLDDCDLYVEDGSGYCDGQDWFCQDGVCPTCNYDKYLKWITAHGHCETGSWDCPDEGDCPWKKGLFDFKE